MSSRRRAAALAAVLLALVVTAGCGDDDDGGEDAATTSTTDGGVVGPVTPSTVPRDGDPEYCAALVEFQALVTTVSEPPSQATSAEVEQLWNDLAVAEGTMVENAPDELVVATQQVATAFDQFRLDADNVGYDYATLTELESSDSIDPGSAIAAGAAAIFTYGDERCPEPAA